MSKIGLSHNGKEKEVNLNQSEVELSRLTQNLALI